MNLSVAMLVKQLNQLHFCAYQTPTIQDWILNILKLDHASKRINVDVNKKFV